MSQAGINALGGGTVVETLKGNDLVAVPPTGNNINVVGTGAVTTSGNAGTSTLTIAVSGGGFVWNDIAGNTVAVLPSNGYVCQNAGLTTLTLPVVATTQLGDTFKVISFGAGGFQIAQRSNNQILFGNATTTPGLAGFLQTDSTETYSSITLVCIIPGSSGNAIWALDGAPVGNITVN